MWRLRFGGRAGGSTKPKPDSDDASARRRVLKRNAPDGRSEEEAYTDTHHMARLPFRNPSFAGARTAQAGTPAARKRASQYPLHFCAVLPSSAVLMPAWLLIEGLFQGRTNVCRVRQAGTSSPRRRAR